MTEFKQRESRIAAARALEKVFALLCSHPPEIIAVDESCPDAAVRQMFEDPVARPVVVVSASPVAKAFREFAALRGRAAAIPRAISLSRIFRALSASSSSESPIDGATALFTRSAHALKGRGPALRLKLGSLQSRPEAGFEDDFRYYEESIRVFSAYAAAFENAREGLAVQPREFTVLAEEIVSSLKQLTELQGLQGGNRLAIPKSRRHVEKTLGRIEIAYHQLTR